MSRIFLSLLCLAVLHPMSHAQTLASFVDRNRILLLFAPTDQDAQLRQQLKLLDHHAADLHDRDLLIIPVLGQSGPPRTANTLRTLNPPAISDREQLTIRHRFRVEPTEFAAILLGKDGGEKLRSASPVPIERLREVIDAMPMRQQEQRDRARR